MSETVTRSKRKECWGARDLYYECLDSNGNDDTKCKNLLKTYESACPKAWIQHFGKRRLTAAMRTAYSSQPADIAIQTKGTDKS